MLLSVVHSYTLHTNVYTVISTYELTRLEASPVLSIGVGVGEVGGHLNGGEQHAVCVSASVYCLLYTVLTDHGTHAHPYLCNVAAVHGC